MERDNILGRWRANAAAAGVRLTDEDIARIEERGILARVETFEAKIARIDARNVVPDYLHLLSANEPKHDRP